MKISIKLFTFLTVFGFALGNINLASANNQASKQGADTGGTAATANDVSQQKNGNTSDEPTKNKKQAEATKEKTGNTGKDDNGETTPTANEVNQQENGETTDGPTKNKKQAEATKEKTGNTGKDDKEAASESYLFGLTGYELFGIATLSTAIVSVVYYYYGYKSEETDADDVDDVDE